MKVVVYSLVLLAVTLAALPVSGERAPTPYLVYEVMALGDVREVCFSHECYLFVQVVGGNSSHLLVNVTFARGTLVRVGGYVFVRPREAASLLLAVDAETWSAYANGVHLGRLPFYGLEPGKLSVTLATDEGFVTLVTANATRIAAADREHVRISVGNFTRDLPTREYWPALIELLDALGAERLELYSADFDKRAGLLFDEVSGVLCYMRARNHSESPVALLKLLGLKGDSVHLKLFKVADARPAVALAEEAPVDPPEIPAKAARFVPV